MSEDAGASIIELAGVTKVYGGAVPVEALRGVDFVVREREFVAVMGPSGSGKTTLLGIVGCLDRPTAGSYRLVGQEVATLDETQPRQDAGPADRLRLPGLQPPAAVDGVRRTSSCRSSTRGVPARERRRRALEALEQVGPRRPRHASADAALRRRAAARRDRARGRRSAERLLLDEPTGNLDSASAEDVLTLLEQLHRDGATIVIVTHSTEVAQRAARVLQMEDGLVVADGPVERVLAAGAAR